MLLEHGDVIEADLQRHYRVDLVDLWRGRISLRKVRVLIDGLPADSRTANALAGADPSDPHWPLTDAILARLTDELAALRWEWGWAHTPKDKRSSYPKPPAPIRPLREKAAEEIPVVKPHELGAFLRGGGDQ